MAATDPVGAADRLVLVKQTIRAVSQAHGLPGLVRAGGGRRPGRQRRAPALLGLVGRRRTCSPAGTARTASPAGASRSWPACSTGCRPCAPSARPSVASYLRLVPQRWAGACQCWGRENREAALRFVTGTAGDRRQRRQRRAEVLRRQRQPLPAGGRGGGGGRRRRSDGGHRLPAEVTVDPAGAARQASGPPGCRSRSPRPSAAWRPTTCLRDGHGRAAVRGVPGRAPGRGRPVRRPERRGDRGRHALDATDGRPPVDGPLADCRWSTPTATGPGRRPTRGFELACTEADAAAAGRGVLSGQPGRAGHPALVRARAGPAGRRARRATTWPGGPSWAPPR